MSLLTLEPAQRFILPSMTDETLDRPLRAGELARRTGLSKDALRFYERKGLLPRPRRLANNYRAYPPETVERVLWIRRVLAAGFTLDELARILALRESGGIPCRQVRDLGAAKLAEIEARLRDLETTRGAQVRIVTQDPAAVVAVHEFLGAQIGDHRTGDPLHGHAQ